MKKNSKISNAFKIVFDTIKKDKELYYAYQANIAMAFKDEYHRCKKKHKNLKDIHEIANKAACYFLNLLLNVKGR